MSTVARPRPRLVLFLARYRYRPKNAIAATLAWMAEQQGSAFEVYYDAIRAGRHYGGGASGPFLDPEEGALALARPANGYIWDRAAAKGLSYRSYGEFIKNGATHDDPSTTSIEALKGHFETFTILGHSVADQMDFTGHQC